MKTGLTLTLAALALGAVLRTWDLGALSYYNDELYATRIQGLSARNAVGVVARSAFYDLHPPFYYLLALGWSAAGGTGEVWMRLLSAVAGLGALVVVYRLAADLGQPRAGGWAALVLSILPFHVYYSREARMYSLLALLSAASTWALVRALQRDDGSGRRALHAYIVLAILLVGTHYFGSLLVMGQAVFVALVLARRREAWWAWASAFAIPFAVAVPLAVFARYQSMHLWATYLAFDRMAYTEAAKWLAGGHPYRPLLEVVPGLALAAIGGNAVWRVRVEGRAVTAPARWERGLGLAVALGLAAIALATVVWRTALEEAIARLEVERGETLEVSLIQGRTAVVALAAGAAALALAIGAFASRGRHTALVPTPAASFSALALYLVPTAVVVALTVAAGLLGRPLMLSRNLSVAMPFAALLIGHGLEALGRWTRLAALSLLALACLTIDARLGAVPGHAPGPAVRALLVHSYRDWQQLPAMLPSDGAPVVTVLAFVTDPVFFYLPDREVVRVGVNADGEATVRQVQSPTGRWRVGDPFHAHADLHWVDVPSSNPNVAGPRAALAQALRAEADCTFEASMAGDADVFHCRPR